MSASLITDARPYANALFDMAHQDNMLLAWNEVLQALSAVGSNREFHDFVSDPSISDGKSKQVLHDLLQKLAPESVAQLGNKIDNLLSLLLEEQRIDLLGGIAAVYHEKLIATEDKKEAIVSTVVAMTEQQQQKLQARLKERFGVAVEMVYQQDPEIIAGLRVSIGNLVIDNTVAGRMSRLQETLERAG